MLVAGHKVPAERTGKMIQRRLKGITWPLGGKTRGRDMPRGWQFLGQIAFSGVRKGREGFFWLLKFPNPWRFVRRKSNMPTAAQHVPLIGRGNRVAISAGGVGFFS